MESHLYDRDRFPELHLELAGVHAFLPEIGQRLELAAIRIFHTESQGKLGKGNLKPPVTAFLQEIDELEILLQPAGLRFAKQGEQKAEKLV